jgi:hypothetical protein
MFGMAHSTTRPGGAPIEQMRTIVDLLENPALAAIYTCVLSAGTATVDDLLAELDVPQGTAYDYVRKLETAGLLRKTREERPYLYEAEPLSVTLTTDDDTRTVTPALIDAVARRVDDGDIDVYVERHGVDGLATALDYAREYVDGTVNHRIAARELDLSALEAEIILQALEAVVRDHRDE